MTPMLAIRYHVNRMCGYAVFPTQSRLRDALRQLFADFNDIGFLQLASAALLAARTWGNVSALLVSVAHVIGRRTKPEMRRIHARGIIALVANEHAVRDWAKVKFVAEAVCAHPFSVQAKFAVPGCLKTSLPFPAGTNLSWRNMFPEACGRRTQLTLSRAMSKYKAAGFALDISGRCLRLLRDGGLLSATTVAITVWDFVRGMILHVVSPPRLSAKAGTLARRLLFLLGCYQSIVPQMGMFSNGNGEPTPAAARNGQGE